MAYIVGTDRNQSRMITASLDDLIDKDNSVRAIDAYVNSLNLLFAAIRSHFHFFPIQLPAIFTSISHGSESSFISRLFSKTEQMVFRLLHRTG